MTGGTMRVGWHALIAGVLTVAAIFSLSCRMNQAPLTPAAPSGPLSGKVDSLHAFTSVATDPEGGGIRYRFDWGDGDTSAWTDSVPSGQPGGASHAWHAIGSFVVRAQAKDAGDALSAWSDGHQVDVAVSWIRVFSGTKYKDGKSVQQTTDGGYIVAGRANSKLWLLKTDSCGSLVWEKTFGPPEGASGVSVQQTSDGGYVVAGTTASVGTALDFWLVKTDAAGNMAWSKTFGGTEDEQAVSVQQTSDGGYVVTGHTQSYGSGDFDIWLVKTDVSGNKVWDKTFGGANIDQGKSVQQTSDGGYIIVGFTCTYEVNSSDVRLFKTDSAGNTVWDKTFGGGTVWDEGNSVQQTTEGGYIIGGSTGAGVWLVKTDASGNKVWDKTLGGQMFGGQGNSVRQTAEGGYIVAGYVHAQDMSLEFALLRTDASGNMIWNKTFGTPNLEAGASVRQTSDGGFIMTGDSHPNDASSGDAWLIKTGANGE
jgi:hypothetical protein